MNKIRGVLLLLIFICVATAILNENFVSDNNLENVMARSARFGIISIGVAFVIITGGIDLSIGSVVGLTGCVLAMLIKGGTSDGMAILFVIALSALIGLTHGLLITKIRLQPFIVTLCGLLIYRGLAQWITGNATQGFGNAHKDTLMLLATGKPCSMAFAIMIAGLCLFVGAGVKWRLSTRRGDLAQRSFFLPGIAIAGMFLLVVGSSRYWYGITYTYSFDIHQNWLYELIRWGEGAQVPKSAANIPGKLLWCLGLLCLPAILWFFVLAFIADRKRIVVPTIMLLVASGLLLATVVAASIEGLGISIPWQGKELIAVELKGSLRIAMVFSAVAAMFVALSWFGRVGLRCVGPAARTPLAIAVVTLLGFLLGHNASLLEKMLQSDIYGKLMHAKLDENMVLSSLGWFVGKTSFTNLAIPLPFIVMVVIAALAGLFLNRTIYGRYMLALGRSEEAARFSGISTDRMKILAYIICSTTAGIGSILFTLDGNSVQPSGHGNYYELYAIAAAVLGGCSLRGGEGSILAVVLGAAVIRLIYAVTGLIGIPSTLEFAIVGTVILVGAIVDEYIGRFTIRRHAAQRAEQDEPPPEP